MDLSLRTYVNGWKAVYLADTTCLNEVGPLCSLQKQDWAAHWALEHAVCALCAQPQGICPVRCLPAAMHVSASGRAAAVGALGSVFKLSHCQQSCCACSMTADAAEECPDKSGH